MATQAYTPIGRADAPVEMEDDRQHRRLLAMRANASLARNDERAMELPLKLVQYAVADLPAASGYAGSLVYVTDETGGATVAYSNGTSWLRVYDAATVS
jgi:hypothetical protein